MSLKALAQINDPTVKLAIVGEGPHREALEEQIIQLKSGDPALVMAGHCPDPQRWFPAFDVAISPSHDMEGVPQGVLQSLASRIATIATDAGGTGDAVIDRRTGLLIAQNDVDALREAIVTLYQDASLRRQLAEAGP